MDTASTSESVNHLRPASAVKLLPSLVAPREVSEEETPVLGNVRPLLSRVLMKGLNRELGWV